MNRLFVIRVGKYGFFVADDEPATKSSRRAAKYGTAADAEADARAVRRTWDLKAGTAVTIETTGSREHRHEYADHPSWPRHLACRVCGFAIPKSALAKRS